MNATFWSHTIWYVLLGIFALAQVLLCLYNSNYKKFTFAVYLTIAGIAFSIETILLIFLKSYHYCPEIISNPPMPFDDELAGNVFSQISVSATALIFVVFNLNFYWAFIIAAVYGCIEELFLALDIYAHHWYHTWMTVSAFPFFLWTIRKIHKKMITGLKPIFYNLLIMFGLFTIYIVMFLWGILMLFRIEDFSLTWLLDPIKSRHTLVLIQFLFLSIPILVARHFLISKRWKAVVLVAQFITFYIFNKLNLFMIKDGWFIAVAISSICWMYASIVFLDKWFKSKAVIVQKE